MTVKSFFVTLITLCLVSQYVQADSGECGRISDSLQDANSFPWTVELVNRRTNLFFCAGSLISSKHVLSGESQLMSLPCYVQRVIENVTLAA